MLAGSDVFGKEDEDTWIEIGLAGQKNAEGSKIVLFVYYETDSTGTSRDPRLLPRTLGRHDR